MSAIYYLIQKFTQAIRSIYFKDVKIVGLENIPKSGPLIICGNHANQFIDPLMIASIVKRHVSYTMAASSFSKPVIGPLAKALKSIPVKRPEDHKIKGTGLVKMTSSTIIKGEGTKFIEETATLGVGWSILIKAKVIPVKSVIDDTTIEFAPNSEFDELINQENKFFVSLNLLYLLLLLTI
jgi:glycerol-3-phosphate O-acyltransferase / dihydroxyacetone phosphate acyltransferase